MSNDNMPPTTFKALRKEAKTSGQDPLEALQDDLAWLAMQRPITDEDLELAIRECHAVTGRDLYGMRLTLQVLARTRASAEAATMLKRQVLKEQAVGHLLALTVEWPETDGRE